MDETVEYLLSMAKREQKENERDLSMRGEKTPKTERELQEYIVSGLPNISSKLAERLLESFETLRKVFDADKEELKEVEGIGDKKADRIVEILDKKY